MKDTNNIVRVSVLEERMSNMCKQNNSDHTEILKRIDEINEKLDKTFVTNERFKPVEKVAYGLISAVLLAVIGAVISLVIK